MFFRNVIEPGKVRRGVRHGIARWWRELSFRRIVFAEMIVHILTTEYRTARFEAPFIGVGVVPDFRHGIVRDQIVEQIIIAGIDQLMRAARRMHHDVARSHLASFVTMAHYTRTTDDPITLPLGRVAMKRTTGFAGFQFPAFQIKGVTAMGQCRIHHCPQSLGYLLACAMKLSTG